jgi:hypothetical protein
VEKEKYKCNKIYSYLIPSQIGKQKIKTQNNQITDFLILRLPTKDYPE